MKQVLFVLVLAVVLSGMLVELKAQEPTPEVPFVVLHQDDSNHTGNYTRKQAKVIDSQEEYAAALAVYTPFARPATVDFTRGRVLLVDMGERPSGGYKVEVLTIEDGGNWVMAHVRLTSPGRYCGVPTYLANPYQFVYIPTTKEILISERAKIHRCKRFR